MNDLYAKTATELIALIRSDEIKALDVVMSCLERIASLEPTIHAWQCTVPERALDEARRIDAGIARGEFKGRLYGMPVGIKDIFNTEGMATEMGSLIWKGFQPGNDARVVFNIRYDGGVVLGKTKTSEFAVHEPTDTRNPRRIDCAPGTSSGGSAAAVASGMLPLSLCSQTAGSITRPASYCGVFGFKPTFGTVPRTGVLKTTDTLDTIGWMTRSLDDIELFFEVTRVSGPNYPFVQSRLIRRPLDRVIRLGLIRGPHWDEAEDYAKLALQSLRTRLEASGRFMVEDYELPDAGKIYDDHDDIYCKALSYYFRGEERNVRDKISNILLGMLDHGEGITPAAYHEAIRRQAERTRALDESFPHDAWITLSAGGEAPQGLRSPDRRDTCKIWTYLGLPTLSLPLFASPSGLPLGLQLVGRKYTDYNILDIARIIWELGDGAISIADPRQGEDHHD